MSDMEKITHLADRKEWKILCGHDINCGKSGSYYDVYIHHCATTDINKVSCADCADTYAQQQYIKQDAKLTLNEIYGKGKENIIRQSDLVTAFKIIAAKDKEIAQLENENEKLEERSTIFENEISRLAKVGEKRYNENKQLTSELTKSSSQVFNLNVQNAQLQREFRQVKDENIRLAREFRDHKMSIMNRLQEIAQEQY